jgi:hypothetical protein
MAEDAHKGKHPKEVHRAVGPIVFYRPELRKKIEGDNEKPMSKPEEAMTKVIDEFLAIFETVEEAPHKIRVDFHALFLGKLPPSDLLRVEIKVGSEFGWLYGKYHMIVFDQAFGEPVNGTKRFYLNRKDLQVLCERELSKRLVSKEPKLNHLQKVDGNIYGYISLEKAISI